MMVRHRDQSKVETKKKINTGLGVDDTPLHGLGPGQPSWKPAENRRPGSEPNKVKKGDYVHG